MKNLKTISGVLLLLTSNACTTVQIKDHTLCLDLIDSAHCTTTVSNQSWDLTYTEWESIRLGRISISGDDWAEIKKTILKLCKKSKSCVYPKVKKSLDSVEKGLSK